MMVSCTYCGTGVDRLDALVCPTCGQAMAYVPWEQPSAGNWLGRWLRTCGMGMWRPTALFRSIRFPGQVGPALWFFVLCIVVQAGVTLLMTGWLTASLGPRMLQAAGVRSSFGEMAGLTGLEDLERAMQRPGRPRQDRHTDPQAQIESLLASMPSPWLLSVSAAVVTAVGAVVGVLLLTLTFQLGALLFIPNRRPLANTFTAVSYAHAPVLWTLLPLIGGLIFALWMSVTLVVGLREVHQTTTGRVMLALCAIPTVAMLLLGGACVVMIGSLTAAL